MLSFAHSLDHENGALPMSALVSQFTASRGTLYEDDARSSGRAADRQTSSRANESLDTLELTPPRPEEIIIKTIERLIETGDIAAAAERLGALDTADLRFDFSEGEALRLQDMARRMEELREKKISSAPRPAPF